MILYRRKAAKVDITITNIVVAKNHHWKKVIIARPKSTNIEVPHAKPSSQSVIFTAFTIATVSIKVNIK